MNIRNETDLATLIAAGWKWVTVAPRGDDKGAVRSKHRSYDAAEKAARGLDRAIVDLTEAHTY